MLVGAKLPVDAKERSDLLFSGLAGVDLENLPQYYLPYEQVAAELLSRAKPLSALRELRPESAHLVDSWLRAHGRAIDSVVWLPNVSRNDTTMLMDARTGQPLDAVPIDPW